MAHWLSLGPCLKNCFLPSSKRLRTKPSSAIQAKRLSAVIAHAVAETRARRNRDTARRAALFLQYLDRINERVLLLMQKLDIEVTICHFSLRRLH